MKKVLVLLLGCTGVASADPYPVGPILGSGINVSATGGPSFEVGLHILDVVDLSACGASLGETYHGVLQARWFPIRAAWRPYVLAGVGELNNEGLFEDFIELGLGGEFRWAANHWAVYGEGAADLPYSSTIDGRMASPARSFEAQAGIRFYL